MELFLPHLQSLRYHFKYLSSDEQDTALGMVLSAVQHMREDSVCRRIHCEAERSLADETEKMIFEKFSGDWLPLSHCSSPRFSWDLKDGIGYSCKQSMLFDSMGTLENDSQTAKKRDGNCTSELISSVEYPERFEPTEHKQEVGTSIDENSPQLFLRRELGNYICATCAYEANNRKALYRHGQSTRHVVRLTNQSGSIVCGLCTFTTNKKYNYDRHLRRVHFSVRSHRCGQCDKIFKDSCTLKGHLKWHARKLHDSIDGQDPTMGTWFGVNEVGRVGILLSVTQPEHTKNKTAPSRGSIPMAFMKSEFNGSQFCGELFKAADQYNGFQFIGLERNEHNYDMHTVGRYPYLNEKNMKSWPPGIYVLGNSEASTPFKKVSYGQKLFEEVITNLDENTTVTEIIGKLLDIGSDRMVCFPDPQVRLQCGDNGDNLYRYLCSIMVQFPNSVRYGTRSHSIFIVDRNDNATFYEKSMYEIPEDVENAKWVEKTFHFKLK